MSDYTGQVPPQPIKGLRLSPTWGERGPLVWLPIRMLRRLWPITHGRIRP